MSAARETPRLRRGETLLMRERESRLVRMLADGFVCVLSIGVGVAFHAFVMGGGTAPGSGVLFTIALTLAPIFAFLASRPLSEVLLTDQRLFVGFDPDDLQCTEFHQITATRLWLATLFLRLRDGKTLAIGNMRRVYAIEAEILRRSPR